jgi:hypothetical protein
LKISWQNWMRFRLSRAQKDCQPFKQRPEIRPIALTRRNERFRVSWNSNGAQMRIEMKCEQMG